LTKGDSHAWDHEPKPPDCHRAEPQARARHVQRQEDHTKDIDFTPAGIRARRQAGYADARKMLEAAPWSRITDPLAGVLVCDARLEG
jgi:hypothetical protein